MDRDKLRELQFVQMLVMDEIHKICKNKGLRYYLIGGSALGAVRHKGFIPWDVDIDIAMPRKDYEQFVTECSKELPKGFVCVDYRTDKAIYSPHALVVMEGTKLVQQDDILNPQLKRYGIFVDILPLDQCPNDNKQWEKQKKQIAKWANLRYRKLSLIYASNTPIERAIKKITRFMMLCLPMSYINRKQSEVIQTYDFLADSECKRWCSMVSHYSLDKLSMPKEFFGEPKLMQFENREYYVPERVIDYLTQLFGDYMKQPSKEKQQEMYDFFVDASW